MCHTLRHLISYTILLTSIFACGQARKPNMNEQRVYHNLNQTQFTFVVFDRSAVDSFFAKYKPLSLKNETLKRSLQASLLDQHFNENKKEEVNVRHFAGNTEPLDTSSFNLAINVLKATLEEGGEEYFSGSLHYLFFYECLPQKFKYKWSQSTLGHFEFNASFFALLRDKSKELDDLIYGNEGYWAEDMKTLFSEYIFNEITPDMARKIKNTITEDVSFDDNRFATDRANFIEFLDRTISKEWRLVLIDWD